MRIYFILLVILLSSFVSNGVHVRKKQAQVTVSYFQVPVLRESDQNAIIRIKIESKNSLEIRSMTLNLTGSTDLRDVKHLDLFYSGRDSLFNTNRCLTSLKELDNNPLFEVNEPIPAGINYLWISCTINQHANLLNSLTFEVEAINFGKKSNVDMFSNKSLMSYRYGVALRQHGQDGVDTYRIPGLATTQQGTLCAIYDARRNSSRDLQGDIDIGLNRSFDGGNSWQPMQIIIDMGNWGGLPQKFNGVSDACILISGKNIFVAGLWMYGVIGQDGKWIEGLKEESKEWNHQWRNKGSQPGFSENQTAQFLIVKSSDNGSSWSKPINLTKMCKKEEWWLWAPAPGRGIVMEDGTLVFPTQGRDKNGLPFSNITYSKDGGSTWQTSNAANSNTTECAVVEYNPGQLMLNIRDNRNRQNKSTTNGRAVFTTSDLGDTWKVHQTSHGALPEPVCMASLHKHPYLISGQKKQVLLFSNPSSKYHRKNMTLKMSYDDGKSWPKHSWILLDEGRGRGYSCITSIDEQTIGIVYEGSGSDLVFQKIDISTYLK